MEDEEDTEVMALVEKSKGGQFLQKVRQRARPLSSTRPSTAGGEGEGGRTRVVSGSARGVATRTDSGRGRTTSAMIRQKIRCTAIGCSQFELLASPVAVRQSLPDLLDTCSLFLSLTVCFSPSLPSFIVRPSRVSALPLAPSPPSSLPRCCCCRHRRRRPPSRGNGRRREGPKKLRKKNPISLPW